jgi:hypothetical protein
LNISPLKEFDTWEAMGTKMYPALKMFTHEAFGQQLAAIKLRNMSGQNGYSLDQNIHNILDGANDMDDDTVTTVTQTAAAATTTGSTTTTTTIVIPPKMLQQSTSSRLTKPPSCHRWRQCLLRQPQPKPLKDLYHANHFRFPPSNKS